MNSCQNVRFIERDYWIHKTLCNSENLVPRQVEQMLDETKIHWNDLTFKFFHNGTVIIQDNDTNNRVHPRELTGAALDFYIRKRIYFIKVNLQEKLLQYA